MKIKKKIPVDLIERMNTLCDRLDLDSVSELINYINVNVTQPHDDYNELVMYSSSPTKIIQFECDDEVSQLIKEQTFPTWLFSQIVGTKYYSHFFKTLTKADYSSEICDELYKNLPGANYREEQKECILNLSQTLNENKIGFVEASTGTGKALASLIAAAEQVSLGNKPLLIATATRALLRQLDEKESPLIKASFEIVFKEKTLKVARLSGMNSYVSPQLLRDLIATDDITDNDKISAKKYIEMSEQNGQWLVEDLESLVSDEFPFDVVKITETVDEENAEPYLTAKENARSADIMIITHTLAIMDIMYDGKILNIQDQQQRHMIIDEGHLFEKSVSSAMSNQYHVASQLTACRQLIQSLKKCKKCDRYLSMLLLLSGELEASLKEGKNWYKGDSSSVVKSYGKEHDGIDSFNSMMKKMN